VAAALLNRLHEVMRKFESYGFDGFAERWSKYDWLKNRDVTVDQAGEQVVGVAAGVDREGALLVNTETGTTRVVSGSVMVAGLAA
jgi:BirA family biotin operon repressor/biotin-[acetyl-CoA-carboxylase] ligase